MDRFLRARGAVRTGLRTAVAVLLLGVPARASEATLATFDACWSRVRLSFYDAELHGVDWNQVRDVYRPRADQAQEGDELHRVLRSMLAELGASHTSILSAEVYRAMSAELSAQRVPTCGLLLEEDAAGRLFVAALYEGGPAASAGLRLGDRILSLDGAAPAASGRLVHAGYDSTDGGGRLWFLRAEDGVGIELGVQGDASGRERWITTLDPRRMCAVDATRNSRRIYRDQETSVGYLHLWFCSKEGDRLVRDALRGPLAGCDAVILDLRGRGGYLEVARRILEMFAPGSKGEWWPKPALFLVDQRTRSAKEVMAHVIRRDRLGTLVGEDTEGAVLGAGFFRLPDGSYLELAVMDVPVVGGHLEGVGVPVHLRVDLTLPYAAGRDRILEAGIRAAFAAAREARGGRALRAY